MNDLQSYSTPPRRVSRFVHTERFSERKRALFPTNNKESDDSSDLGTKMIPSESSSSPDRYSSPISSPFSNIHTFACLFEKITPLKSNDNKENEVILAPNTPSPNDSPSGKTSSQTSSDIPETPTKLSPTQALKTPHDSTSVSTKVPKLVRKSLLDLTNLDKVSTHKRKAESPLQTVSQLEIAQNKVSKARTALFLENIMPVKTFYPNTNTNYKPSQKVFSEPLYNKGIKATKKAKHTMYLCSRKKVGRRSFGEINAGVRHGIRRPKNKPKVSKTQLLRAAINILDKSPLNSYLEDIEKKENENEPILKEQLTTMDSLLKNITSNVEVYTAQPLNNKPQTEIQKPKTGKKRALSPVPDQSKKFFKTSRTHATVTISKNIKLKIDNGEMSLVEKNKRKRMEAVDFEFDTSDLITPEDKLIETSFTDILKSLEDDNIIEKDSNSNKSNIVLTAHNSVSASENSIQLHTAPNDITDKIMSPTTLMGGLALNSPTAKHQNHLVNNNSIIAKQCISFVDEMPEENHKLYPIFYQGAKDTNVTPDTNTNTKRKETQAVQNLCKFWKPLSDDQMLIDAGQKKFGHTQCSECHFVYHIGDPEDENMHLNYHHSINILRFNGWKNERVVTQLGMGPGALKIVLVQPGDSKIWWRKAKDVVDVVNRELGFINVPLDEHNCKVYIYIRNKQIQGCLVAEPKSAGHRMLVPSDEGAATVDHCSEETYPVLCGVSRIWTSGSARKQGVATMLMNSLRCNYIYGHALSLDEIAFSSPTEAGKAFIARYSGTREYLVYMS